MLLDALAITVGKETHATVLFQNHTNLNVCVFLRLLVFLFAFTDFMFLLNSSSKHSKCICRQFLLEFDVPGKQIKDNVHHSNTTSERRPIISLSEAAPLHPTHSGKLGGGGGEEKYI